MKITKRQLRRIIREIASKSTKKYDDDSALQGDQDDLPDALQKGIIDKTVDDREEEKEKAKKMHEYGPPGAEEYNISAGADKRAKAKLAALDILVDIEDELQMMGGSTEGYQGPGKSTLSQEEKFARTTANELLDKVRQVVELLGGPK